MLYLTTTPRVLSLLLSEIATSAISSPIRDAEAQRLPYLQTVIKEGLRIHPPLAVLMSKEVPPGGDTLNGVFVPGGTKIGIGVWPLYRDKQIWGENARVFRPERWLEKSPENIKEMDATLELVFAYGRWQCLGKNVAMLELNKMFVEVRCLMDLRTRKKLTEDSC